MANPVSDILSQMKLVNGFKVIDTAPHTPPDHLKCINPESEMNLIWPNHKSLKFHFCDLQRRSKTLI